MFRIEYNVKSNKNLVPEEDVIVTSLSSAIESYSPDATLLFQIGDTSTEINLAMDMYGLHQDLLELLKHLAFNLPSYGPYLSVFEQNQIERIYSIRLTESYSPRIVYFFLHDRDAFIQTRTLKADRIITSDDDTVMPVACPKKDIILSFCRFLESYLEDLSSQIDAIKKLDDYHIYLNQINEIKFQTLNEYVK